jgi:hypothetical protein
MRAKYIKDLINEISRAENAWADEQIDKWIESQKMTPLEQYNQYVSNIVNYLWNRLVDKLGEEGLKYTGTDKETLEEYITDYDSPYGLYMSVDDYWQEDIDWEEAAESMFDEVYRSITAQGSAM